MKKVRGYMRDSSRGALARLGLVGDYPASRRLTLFLSGEYLQEGIIGPEW